MISLYQDYGQARLRKEEDKMEEKIIEIQKRIKISRKKVDNSPEFSHLTDLFPNDFINLLSDGATSINLNNRIGSEEHPVGYTHQAKYNNVLIQTQTREKIYDL